MENEVYVLYKVSIHALLAECDQSTLTSPGL